MKAKIFGFLAGMVVFVAGVFVGVQIIDFSNVALTFAGMAVSFCGGMGSVWAARLVYEFVEDKEYSNG